MKWNSWNTADADRRGTADTLPGAGSLGFAVHELPGMELSGMELPGVCSLVQRLPGKELPGVCSLVQWLPGKELPGVCTLIQQPPYTEYLWHRIPLPPAPDLTLVCQDATIYVTVRYIQENRMSDDLPGENRKR